MARLPSIIAVASCLLLVGSAIRIHDELANLPEDGGEQGAEEGVEEGVQEGDKEGAEEGESPAPPPGEDTSYQKQGLADMIFGRNMRLNATAEQEAMDGFVLQENEDLLLAFSTLFVNTYFTSDRILFKRTKLYHGLPPQWTSLSYDVIKAWSMRSSGTFLLQETALKVWTSVQSPDASVLNVTFRNTTKDDETMIYDVNLLLTQKLIGEEVDEMKFSQFGKKWTWQNLFWFWNVGFHSKKLDQAEVEKNLRAKVPLLGDNEEVRLAFQNGRDFEVYTNKRFIHVDTRWWTGRVVEYRSIPWREAAVWSIKSAEVIDIASDMELHTAIPGLPTQHVRVKPTPELEHAIHRVCSEQVMQGETDPNVSVATRFPRPGEFFRFKPELSTGANFDQLVRREVPALLNVGEEVRMYIKDWFESTAITTQRWIGVRRGFRSLILQNVPWPAVRTFTMRYNNGFRWMGQHGGLRILTGVKGTVSCETKRITSAASGGAASSNCQTLPGMGRLEHNFRWFKWRGFKPDFIYLHRMLSEKVLGKVEGQPSVETMKPNPDGAYYSRDLQLWLEGDAGEFPPAEAQKILDGQQFLLPGERVTFALRLWRNTMVSTDKRLVMFQRFGIFGRIMEYTSIPFSSIVAFQTRSAGVIKIGGEVRVWTNTPADHSHVFRLSLINGMDKSEGAALMLAKQLLLTSANGYNKNGSSLLETNPLAKGFHWLFGNYGNITEEQAEEKIRKDAPLLDEEQIFAAFQSGRDMVVLTTLRLLIVDVTWFSGKSILYRSVPYSSCRMWSLDQGLIWHRLDIFTDVHREYGRNIGIGLGATGSALTRVSTRFQAGNVDAGIIDNFLRDKILKLNARPTPEVNPPPSGGSN